MPVTFSMLLFCRAGDFLDITPPLLYDLEADIGETTNVAAENPEVEAELMTLIDFARTDIDDFDRIGVNAR